MHNGKLDAHVDWSVGQSASGLLELILAQTKQLIDQG